jgi:hypothetical protein
MPASYTSRCSVHTTCCTVLLLLPAAHRAVPVEEQAVQAPDGVVLAVELAQLELDLQRQQQRPGLLSSNSKRLEGPLQNTQQARKLAEWHGEGFQPQAACGCHKHVYTCHKHEQRCNTKALLAAATPQLVSAAAVCCWCLGYVIYSHWGCPQASLQHPAGKRKYITPSLGNITAPTHSFCKRSRLMQHAYASELMLGRLVSAKADHMRARRVPH